MKVLLTLLVLIYADLVFSQTRTLEYFLEQAKQNSPVARDYQNQLTSLQLDSQLLKSSLGPQVNFQSTNSYAPIVKGWGYDEVISNIAQVSGVVQASRTFLTHGNIAAQYRAITLQRRSLLDTILLSQQDMVRTITDQYITAYGDLLTTSFSQQVYELMKREEQALKKLTEASVYKQTDYLAFYVTLQQQELTYLQAQIQYNTNYLTLNVLAGLIDTTIEKIAPPTLSDTLFNNQFFHSVFSNRFVTDSLRLANQSDLLDYEYKPKIGAYTDAGYNSSLQFTPFRNVGFSAGISLIIPIYNGHQKQIKQSRISIQERTRQYQRDFFVHQYQMQWLQLKQQFEAINGLVNKINRQIDFAHTLIVANGKLLQTGDITIKDYVLAINNYINAQNLLAQNNISRLRILGQVAYWNVHP